MYTQLEFEFNNTPVTDEANFIPTDMRCFNHLNDYRVNKYVDAWCDNVPRWLGWGIYDFYRDMRLNIVSVYQKLRYGSSNRECWDLYVTLARYNLKKLRHFKRMHRQGYPASLSEAEWERIIDESIWAFDFIVDPEKYNPIPDCDWQCKNNIKKSSFNKDAFAVYMDKQVQLNERRDKALHNFAKYFQNFWD